MGVIYDGLYELTRPYRQYKDYGAKGKNIVKL